MEIFFKRIVSDRMYWTRDILDFFGIQEDDTTVFLNLHQFHRNELLKKFSSRNTTSMSFQNEDYRTGSYFNKESYLAQTGNNYGQNDEDVTAKFLANRPITEHSDSVSGSSFMGKMHIETGKFVVQDNYMYGSG